MSKAEYALGTTRMFFKMGAAAFLEELADADPEEMKPKLMEMFAVFEQKRKAKPMMEKTVRRRPSTFTRARARSLEAMPVMETAVRIRPMRRRDAPSPAPEPAP